MNEFNDEFKKGASLERRGKSRGIDRRKVTRFRCQFPIIYETLSEPLFHELAMLVDISSQGARFSCRNELEVVSEIKITLYIPNESLNGFQSCEPILSTVTNSRRLSEEGIYESGIIFNKNGSDANGINIIMRDYS
jgi:hypothetical protein